MTPPLRAPFPWFGGKRRVAPVVWQAFGDPSNYVEPFAGSLAVLLARPSEPRIETVNDLDCYLSNFWRATAADPDEVARWADWPVNEADLHARHKWLVTQEEFRRRMRSDPDFYDAKIAGWWVWGICMWIGSGWCSEPNNHSRPHLKTGGSGMHRVRGAHPENQAVRPDLNGQRGLTGKRVRDLGEASAWEKRPRLDRVHGLVNGGEGEVPTWQQIPDLSGSRGATGRGVHASGLPEKRPNIGGSTGGAHGIHTAAPTEKLPLIGGSRGGHGVHTQLESIVAWMAALSVRLRHVRVCCGDWQRVLGRSPTTSIGLTAVFLDPPYSAGERDPSLYSHDSMTVAADVAAWAREHGDDPKLRIALCGYLDEHQMPATWTLHRWKANGGYGNRNGGDENENRDKECIWLSPHCLPIEKPQAEIFDASELHSRRSA